MARRGGKDRGLFERPKGSGVWWILYYDRNGQRHREKVGPKSLARKVYEKRRTDVREGHFFPPEHRRATLFDEIVKDYRASGRKPGQRDTWGSERYRRLHAAFGCRPANSITPAEVEAFRDQLREHLTPATVNRHLQLLRAIFMRAVRDEKATSNPVSKVKLYRENNKRTRWLEDDEERRLFEALPARLKALITVAMHTGLRRGEIQKLTWADVDFASATITIRNPKSGENQWVAMNDTARQTLKGLWESRSKVVVLKDRMPSQSGYVFCAPKGGYLHNLNRYWYRALREAGIRDFRFHDLRHTFASRGAMSGIDLYTLQTLMRHRSPQMTMRYAHLSPTHQREAVRLLDRWSKRHQGSPKKAEPRG